jgi:hypothetical protein
MIRPGTHFLVLTKLAAPFEACPIFLLTAVLFASPLSAFEEASRSEAKAALGALSDRLRVIYQRNGNRADHRWSIEDLGVGADELRGSYFSRKNYSMRWDSSRYEIAVFECTGMYADWDEPATVQLEVNLATGQKQFTQEPPHKLQLGPLIAASILPLGLLLRFIVAVLSPLAQRFIERRRQAGG